MNTDRQEPHPDVVLPALARALPAAISAAQSRLRGKSVTPHDVHVLRQSLKRARALLRALKPVLPKGSFAQLDAEISEVGRSWSGHRDAQVLHDTLVAIRKTTTDPVIAASVSHLLALQPGASTVNGLAELANASLIRLSAVQRVLRSLTLRDERGNLATDSLRRSYRAGRRASDAALQGYSDLQFHDWRKRCKRLREQLLVLWPDAQDEPGRLIHELGRLADLLGKDHDLAYMQVVLADGLALADLPDEGRRLLRWVAEERTVLQGRAAALGRELYAARPREFARRMRRLLEAGAAGQQ